MYCKYFVGFFLPLFFNVCPNFAQTKQIDSMRQKFGNGLADTNTLNGLNGVSKKMNNLALYDSALVYANKALKLAISLGKCGKKGEGNAYYNIGSIYQNQGNLPGALKYLLAALKINETLGIKKNIAACYNGIGNVYYSQANYNEALQNYFSSLKIKEETGDKKGAARSLSNIGLVYVDQGKLTEAENYYARSQKLYEESDDKHGIADSYTNRGMIFLKKQNYKQALESSKVALRIREEIGDMVGITTSYGNISLAYLGMKNYAAAEKFALSALKLAKEEGILIFIKEANQILSDVYFQMAKGDNKYFNLALNHYKDFVAARDSLNNEENTKKTVRLEMNYVFGKKEAFAKAEQEKKEAIALAESKRQKMVLVLISCVLLLVAVFAVFAYRSYLQKQKANEAITLQKEIIEQKQKEILDSIYYARRIQEALLPNERYIERILSRPGKDML